MDNLPLSRFQRMCRAKSSGPGGYRLHARRLGERLVFESNLVRGTFRLFNQLAMFFCLIMALRYGTARPSIQRGIYVNLSK